jgi:GDP-mannose transporter
MNFLLLCIQSLVCVLCVLTVKRLGIISFRNFDMADAKAWFPISCLLVAVIYTGSKSLVSPTPTNVPSCRVDSRVIERQFCPPAAIPDYPRLYHLQKLDHHPHRACHLISFGRPIPERRTQAYGEVLWFGGRVTALTLVSFIFMVRKNGVGEILSRRSDLCRSFHLSLRRGVTLRKYHLLPKVA